MHDDNGPCEVIGCTAPAVAVLSIFHRDDMHAKCLCQDHTAEWLSLDIAELWERRGLAAIVAFPVMSNGVGAD